MKVALVYDRVNKWGGAERVLLALHELFPEAPLYTSVYSEKHAPWASVFPKVIPSFLQKVSFTRTRHELLPMFMPLAYESLNFDQFDLVISVTSEAAKGVLTNGKTKHLCYCLTPTRYLWSGYETYFAKNYVKSVTKPLVTHLRRWDKVAAQRPDVIVSISKEVQRRVKKYYERESEIIHPPVETEIFSSKSNDSHSKEYFLIVSRLVPYKKVDLAIETFNDLGLSLVVIGKGSQEKRLKRMAKANIQFVNDIDDQALGDYYKNAKAFIMPQDEDFGIVSVEAQAAGIPVIAYKKGGALDTIIDKKTGVFFDEQNKESLIAAIRDLKRITFDKNVLIKSANRFSKKNFKDKFSNLVDSL